MWLLGVGQRKSDRSLGFRSEANCRGAHRPGTCSSSWIEAGQVPHSLRKLDRTAAALFVGAAFCDKDEHQCVVGKHPEEKRMERRLRHGNKWQHHEFVPSQQVEPNELK